MKATIKKIAYAPRKLRLVANLVKNMNVEDAMEYLKNVNKKGARIVYKALKSAVANARSMGVDTSGMLISSIRVDASISLKRGRPAARGSVKQVVKRYSTLTVGIG